MTTASTVGVLALVGALGLGLVGARLWVPDDPSFTRAEVLAYQEAVYPLASEWGRIEVHGMRPAIADLQTEGGLPAETIAGEARHWQATLGELRRSLGRVPVPDSPELRRASALFDQSIAEYLQAAALFERAAEADGEARDDLVADGIAEARQGARRYNEASMRLQAARSRVLLATTPDFPNRPAS